MHRTIYLIICQKLGIEWDIIFELAPTNYTHIQQSQFALPTFMSNTVRYPERMIYNVITYVAMEAAGTAMEAAILRIIEC